MKTAQHPLEKGPHHARAHHAPPQHGGQQNAVGSATTLSPSPITAKDPPAPLNFLRRVLAVTPQKPVANQEAHLMTVWAMRLLQVPAALIKVRRVGHIRGHPVHGSLSLCAPNPQPSSLPPGHAASRPLRSVAPLPLSGAGIFPRYHRLPTPSYDLNPIPISPLPTIPIWKSTNRRWTAGARHGPGAHRA